MQRSGLAVTIDAVGADIIPTVEDVQVFAADRTVGDTETGERIREEIGLLTGLVQAFRESRV